MSVSAPLVLVVCTANICRSPMGAGLLQHALAAQPEPLRSLRVESAGVAARHGERVSENSVIALKKAGIDISGQVSRPLTDALLDEAMAVLCMTESHRAMIQLQAAHPPKNLFLFREFMPQRGDKEIADPYGGPLKVYEAARDEMVEAIPSLIEFLKTQLATGGSR
ncbi:MAG: low molecular weight protein arginine phosphatase [Verrucomicrobia bacterium]|nr:low molecular weight protein arginine phosphatase [Verrucomicrobiota bacterium]